MLGAGGPNLSVSSKFVHESDSLINQFNISAKFMNSEKIGGPPPQMFCVPPAELNTPMRLPTLGGAYISETCKLSIIFLAFGSLTRSVNPPIDSYSNVEKVAFLP